MNDVSCDNYWCGIRPRTWPQPLRHRINIRAHWPGLPRHYTTPPPPGRWSPGSPRGSRSLGWTVSCPGRRLPPRHRFSHVGRVCKVPAPSAPLPLARFCLWARCFRIRPSGGRWRRGRRRRVLGHGCPLCSMAGIARDNCPRNVLPEFARIRLRLVAESNLFSCSSSDGVPS